MDPWYVLSIDIGHELARAARVDARNCGLILVGRYSNPLNHSDHDAFITEIEEFKNFEGYKDVRAVSIGMPGPFDYERGVSWMEHKFQGLRGVDLKHRLEERFQRPVVFLNNGTAFALGAWWTHRVVKSDERRNVLGLDLGHARLLGVTLGFGLGSGFVVYGRSAGRRHGIPPDGQIWNTRIEGGQFEDRVAVKRLHRGAPAGPLSSGELAELTEAVKRLQEDASTELKCGGTNSETEKFRAWGTDLGKGLGKVTANFRPEVVVLGGGFLHKLPDNIRELFKNCAASAFQAEASYEVPFVIAPRSEVPFVIAPRSTDSSNEARLEADATQELTLIGAARYALSALEAAPRSILVAPNEDGLGPSSLAFYVVQELLSSPAGRGPATGPQAKANASDVPERYVLDDLRIDVRNKGKVPYNRHLYDEHIRSGRVRIEDVRSPIELGKKSGRLGFDESLGNLLRYPRLAQQYEMLPVNDLDGDDHCVLTIDIGVPALARAASARHVPVVTIFDHKWGTTFDKVAELYRKDTTFLTGEKAIGDPVKSALERLKADEGSAHLVFLFPHFLTPEVYHHAWRQETEAMVMDIGGVLGGEPPLLSAMRRAFLHTTCENLEPLRILRTVLAGKVVAWQRARDGNVSDSEPDVKGVIESRDEKPMTSADLAGKVVAWQRARDGNVSDSERDVEDVIESRDEKPMTSARRAVHDFVHTLLVRYMLGIDRLYFESEDFGDGKTYLPLVFVSGGGTAVWDDAMWETILETALKKEQDGDLRVAIVACPPPNIAKKYRVNWTKEYSVDDEKRESCSNKCRAPSVGTILYGNLHRGLLPIEVGQPSRRNGKKSTHVRFVCDVTNGTFQEIFPGVDLIVSRAGGGTANDAVACRTPMCSVEEPNHWQVEAIRENMEAQGLTRTIWLKEFKFNPLGIIEREAGDRREENRKMRDAMTKIPNRCEKSIVDTLARLLSDRNTFIDARRREIE